MEIESPNTNKDIDQEQIDTLSNIEKSQPSSTDPLVSKTLL